MSNYLFSIANTMDNLGDRDFYEVMMELAKMRGFRGSVDEFTMWLNQFLHSVEYKDVEWL